MGLHTATVMWTGGMGNQTRQLPTTLFQGVLSQQNSTSFDREGGERRLHPKLLIMEDDLETVLCRFRVRERID